MYTESFSALGENDETSGNVGPTRVKCNGGRVSGVSTFKLRCCDLSMTNDRQESGFAALETRLNFLQHDPTSTVDDIVAMCIRGGLLQVAHSQ